MAWWKITDLTENKTFNSDELPLRLVPCIELIDINEGHKPKHSNIIIEVGTVKVEMHTKTIWCDGKLLGHVDDADRFMLYQRITKNNNGKVVSSQLFVGLTNWVGHTLMARIFGDKIELTELEIPIV